MKLFALTLTATAALSLAACSPAPNTSDASSDSADMTETAAATVEPAAVAESVSSSAASVVIQSTEIYDAPTIEKVAARPGYWQIAHVDPDTHKRYVTKVCVDQDLGRRMASEHPQPPAGWHGGAPDASFLGACPSAVHGGDVIDRNGGTHNAWGDHRNDHGQMPPPHGDGTHPGGHDDNPPAPVHPGGNNHDGDGYDGSGDHHDSSSAANDGHHFPPGDGGAPGRPDSHMGQNESHGASSSHDRHNSH